MTTLNVDGNATTEQAQCKYLGVILNKRLNPVQHVTMLRQRGYARFAQLKPLLRSKLSLKNKRTVYTVMIRSIVLYAAPIWSTISTTQYNKLEILQTKILRHLLLPEKLQMNRDLRSRFRQLEVS